MRRKSFSLVLLIFIIIAVIFIVIFSLSLINGFGNKKENKNKNETEVAKTNETSENVLDSSFFDSLEVIENGADNTTNSTPVTNTTAPDENTNTDSTKNSISLNNHSYNLNSTVKASVKKASNGRQELDVTYPDKKYTITYGTDNSKSFEDLKDDENIKNTIEKSYNVTVTSALKQGTVSNMNLIICTVSEDNTVAYFLITPLKDNEVAYSKIYNSEDNKSLINDLSDPLNSVSSIISSMQ